MGRGKLPAHTYPSSASRFVVFVNSSTMCPSQNNFLDPPLQQTLIFTHLLLPHYTTSCSKLQWLKYHDCSQLQTIIIIIIISHLGLLLHYFRLLFPSDVHNFCYSKNDFLGIVRDGLFTGQNCHSCHQTNSVKLLKKTPSTSDV